MEKLTALIVDDEEKAVRLLTKLLYDTDEFDDIRSANSASAARASLQIFHPDLIFLDIKMPGKNGIEFLKGLQQERISAEIVFVTAYDEFMLEAIRHHAFGYLLKPVDRTDLMNSILDFRHRQHERDFVNRLEKFLEAHERHSRLRFNTRSGYLFVEPADILYCEADGNYTTLHLGHKQYVCSQQLGSVEDMLPRNRFLRVGRSLVVNCQHITWVDRKSSLLTFEKEGKSYSIKIPRMHLRVFESVPRR